jgi:hypothetical protein
MAIITAPLLVGAEEITISLDRCLILNSSHDRTADSKIALQFALPETLNGREIVFAELSFTLPAMRLQADSMFEIRFMPLLTEWSENDLTYDNSEAITDSMSAGISTLKLANLNQFHFDLTPYVREAVEETRSNFGLIGRADLLGDAYIRLPGNLNVPIWDQARIRVVYK